jgi:hypothetical protein
MRRHAHLENNFKNWKFSCFLRHPSLWWKINLMNDCLEVYLSVSPSLSVHANSYFSSFRFFHGELMLPVDRQDEIFMRKNIFFSIIGNKSEALCTATAKWRSITLLRERRHIYIFAELKKINLFLRSKKKMRKFISMYDVSCLITPITRSAESTLQLK